MHDYLKILLSFILFASITLAESAFGFSLYESDGEMNLIVNLDILEICDNGIDDDGDGLVDAFDEDCGCDDLTDDNLINNGDFESSTSCCFALEQKGICLNDWHLVTTSPDYHQPTCDQSDYALLDDVGIVYDGSLVGFGQGGVRTESIGTCLRSTLLAGQTYKLGIDLATMNNIVWDLKEDFNIVVYGVRECSSLIDHDISLPFCESQLGSEAVELFKVNMNSFPNNLMQKFEHEFIVQEDIEAILIYGECGQPSLGNVNAYFYMDNVEIFPFSSPFEFDSQITTADNICTDPIVKMEVDNRVDISYQWYLDSIPINNADKHSFGIGVEDYPDSEFHVLVSGGGGCKLIGPYLIQGDYTEYLVDTICEGDQYVLGDTLISTAGLYTRKVGVFPQGCDSIVNLDLSIATPAEPKFDITPSLNVLLDEVISIAPEEDFLNKLDSYYWRKENSEERLYNLNFSTLSSSELILSLRFYYVDINGCDDFVSFVLEWKAPDSDTEICDNDSDDDGDGLVDVFDPDCNCAINSSTTEYVMTGNVCTDEVLIEIPLVQSRSYQWYIDGVKMDGEINNSLRINKASSGSKFHVAYLDDDCSLIGPIEVRQGNLSEIINDTFCEGYAYDFFGRMITEPGPYQLVSNDEYGCLVNTTINLSRRPSAYNAFTETICEGDFYSFGGEDLYEEGFYQDTLFGTSSTGCDSILSLTLIIDDVIIVDLVDTICAGDQYSFGDQLLSETGMYKDTIKSVSVCDSVFSLALEVQEVEMDSILTNVFTGETYEYDGISYSPGSYTLSENIDGQKCDRIIELIVLEDDGFDLYIPNVFNPTSNSDNSEFKISSDRKVNIKEMQIYDRWGNIVYNRKDFSIDNSTISSWDGTSNGQLAAQGVYSYKIVIDRSVEGEEYYRGQILLIR